ncbi:MAG: ribose-phosphate pyrophosphokinase [Gammaproteobacteria bacterium RIFCSPHIGHO2_12_FULL_35_23]|nr:MAG: ribose-phosphate pyrophosphokinase [Gammaproteobacteria bacterium RIFCSPHIGHO2_12_FULL_35_23]
MSKLILFSGNSNRTLAEKIAQQLEIPLGKAKIGRFSDGEVTVEILENVRSHDVLIFQSTCRPASDNLMELLLLADALRRASATRISAVVPYFGFARQDRRVRSARVAITAKVVADMMSAVGISRVLTVDLHADQIQGFFYMPVDNVYSTPIVLDDIKAIYKDFSSIMVVSPDVGGVVRARALAKHLPGADLSIIDKRRPKANESQVMHIIGEVKNKNCIIVDDIIDTAGTICKAVDALKEAGAATVRAYATHAVLSGNAIENINNSLMDELVVTDTIPLTPEAKNCKKIRQISLKKMLAESIKRACGSESLSSLFE